MLYVDVWKSSASNVLFRPVMQSHGKASLAEARCEHCASASICTLSDQDISTLDLFPPMQPIAAQQAGVTTSVCQLRCACLNCASGVHCRMRSGYTGRTSSRRRSRRNARPRRARRHPRRVLQTAGGGAQPRRCSRRRGPLKRKCTWRTSTSSSASASSPTTLTQP